MPCKAVEEIHLKYFRKGFLKGFIESFQEGYKRSSGEEWPENRMDELMAIAEDSLQEYLNTPGNDF